jgi:subtilisin-like proprotein convertase family protein
MTPTDPLYAGQWHFALIGNIQRIWDEYNGAGVHVGVYDEGTDYNHADLNDNYDASRHVHDNLSNVVNPFPVGPGQAHGTATAGLIGAEANNGIGGVGVAWGVGLTAVNIFGAGVYGNVNGAFAPFADVVHQAAANFDISSNSWGASPLYSTGLSGGGFADLLENEYSYLSSAGRSGRGTIITQAAGNDTLDANGDGVNASRFTITVSATEQTGIVAYYSNFGACILVAAPAASVTTDISGVNGYDPGDYTTTFNGTSAATPVVSGVIALMLQANPNLGWRDVQNILANSASHTGSAFGGPKALDEHGVWGFNSANNWNGGGMHVQTDYGYGMINAYNAVRMAEVWGLFGAPQTSANEQSISSGVNNLGGLAIPDNNPAGVSFNLSVGTSLQIEHVQLVMNFTHTYVGDLKITLTSAEGTTIVVALNSLNVGTNVSGEWVYGIDSLRGELSAGTWTVKVVDTFGGDVGALNSAYLNVFGTAPNVNDVYHITDEYLAMKALSPARGIIADTNAGTDWIDFSTVAGNIILNLNSGSVFSVNSVNWGALGATTVIENAVGGDGNDTITGSGGVNTLYGMRGNDTLSGGSGDDFLYGGAGNDTFDGGLGNDRMDGGLGVDSIDYSAAASALYIDLRVATQANTGGLGTDVISGIENVFGGASADVLIGNAGVNTLYGGAGADALVTVEGDDFAYGGAGDDYVAGRDGNDTLYGGLDRDVMDGGNGIDVLRGNEGDDYLIGGADNDTIYGGDGGTNVGDIGDRWLGGDGGDDFIYGNLGTDRLSGGIGNDVLTGGEGFDYMTGEAGADTFVYNAVSDGTISEQIGDWQGGVDKLRIDASAFGGGLAAGALAANQLVIGTVATEAFGQFLYNTANGVLYWDADGTGAGARVAFTRLFTSAFALPPATIAVTDFDIVV